MIFNKLTLRNFGLFRGEQVLNLTPLEEQGKTAPIVLIGGVNGGGKTTLLDAVQLLLYGNRAPCSGRAGRTYNDFLRESIHRGVDLAQGAEIRLSFSYISEGHAHDYEVSRSWSVVGDRIREQVSILKDAVADNWLAGNWNQLVEDLIPLGISQLCFFDAEKIRFIAEDDQDVLHLGSAIKSLMGLDLAERLVSDVRTLQERIGKRIGKLVDQKDVEKLDEALQAKQEDVDRVVQEVAGLENLREAANRRLRNAEGRFAKLGGPHWQHRETNQRQLLELEQELRGIETRSMALAATELPLALITNLLQDVVIQSERETIASENEIVCRLLSCRDEQLIEILRLKEVGTDIIKAVGEFTDSDRVKRSQLLEWARSPTETNHI
jgi:DNA sulfur modification protein DndD